MDEQLHTAIVWFQELYLSYKPLLREYLYEISVVLIIAVPSVLFAWRARRKARKALQSGDLREEVVVTTIIIEDQRNEAGQGKVFLKPRTSVSAEPIMRSFPNSALVEEIIAATKRCDDTAEGSFILLKDSEMHKTFMKRVVDMVSELGGVGHVVRACGGEHAEYIMYVCVTFSMDGPHRKIRIDMISEQDLEKFLDPFFIACITNRPEEGSHADLAAILAVCARKHHGEPSGEARRFVRRVSVSLPV